MVLSVQPAERLPWLQPAWTAYQDRLRADRLAHALLLHGPAGTGKSLLAHAMVAGLLCQQPKEGSACGQCRSCVLLNGGAHPDWFWLRPEEGKHQIKIDPVRETIRSLGFTTTISRRKVALFEPAEAMNRNAANALLKSLEEPPGDAVLILLSHNPSRLPVTIRSRCQAIAVPMPSDEVALEWLVDSVGLKREQATQALSAAGGSPLRAVAYHEQEMVPAHRELRNRLAALATGRETIPAVVSSVRDVAPDTVWLWLSTLSAERLRQSVGQGGDTRRLVRIQQMADRNRQLTRTAVREDLLLRDWLIEWTSAAQGLGK